MGGVFHRFTVGRPGTSGAHVRALLRPPATGGAAAAVLTRHYPAYVLEAEDDAELREDLAEYCRQEEESERARLRPGGGVTRTHYRVLLSFEGKIGTETALGLAGEYLARAFPTARALAVAHQDTAHTRVQVHLQARGVDGRKLNLGPAAYRRLDSTWAAVYAGAFGAEKLAEHERKKAETGAWKRAYAQAKAAGRAPPPPPLRDRRRLTRADYRAREERIDGGAFPRPGGGG